MTHTRHLVVIAGPTGVGKTDLAIELALYYNTEIISADSRQLFKEMDIGTAKPDVEQLKKVNHHFINSISIKDPYNAGRFEEEANELLDKLYKDKRVVIVAGGSGLYIKALCEGINHMPAADPEIRERLVNAFKEQGIEYLQKRLKTSDPGYFEIVDTQNPQRLIRALEVVEMTGMPYSEFMDSSKTTRPYQIHKIALSMAREDLYARIDKRVDLMIKNGLLDEAKGLYSDRDLNALQTVGYTEIFDYLSGKYNWEEAIRLLKRNSRRYAKRQLTWFKKDKEFVWFRFNDIDGILDWVDKRVKGLQ